MGMNRNTPVADDCSLVAYQAVDVLTTRYGAQTVNELYTELRRLELATEDAKDWKHLWA